MSFFENWDFLHQESKHLQINNIIFIIITIFLWILLYI